MRIHVGLLLAVSVFLATACAGDETATGDEMASCALECGANGTCALLDGAPVCHCDEGFAGASCERCAAGHVGEGCAPCPAGTVARDGACVALCIGDSLDCGAAGVCVDDVAGPACICDEGHEGERCEGCADGWDDADGEGRCERVCPEGYAGEACDLCAAGHQDNDGDGTCTPGCGAAALPCGPGGICVDGSGTATCRCDEGHAGSTCKECEAGWQDNDGDGRCLPDCTTTAVACGAHAVCTDAEGVATCVCGVGYLPTPEGCTWAGGPVDGGFLEEGTWTASGAASVDTAAVGAETRGAATLDLRDCDVSGRISQVFPMPHPEQAEPLALVAAARQEGSSFGLANTIDVAVGGLRQTFVGWLSTGFADASLCLGERAFGGDVELALLAPALCSDRGQLLVDDVRIEPASYRCPAFATVLNGSFDGGHHGWLLQPSPSGTARIGFGEAGDPGASAFLDASSRCSNTRLTGKVSVPLATRVAHPALEVHYLGGNGARAAVSLGRYAAGTLEGTGTERIARICLPPGRDGIVDDLVFVLDGGTGACDGVAIGENWVAIRSLAVVDEPDCTVSDGLLDGGLEVSAPDLSGSPGWRFAVAPSGHAARIHGAATAHSGNGALRFAAGVGCGATEVSTTGILPAAEAGAGPAVRFWYRTEAFASSSFQMDGVDYAASETWTEVTHCLRQRPVAGEAYELRFRHWAGGTCSAANSSAVWLDDVRLVNAAACAPAP
ncbi:hypothetical protein [Vulgatibacter sp.]|uniref:hypothetical protein n=1 Tax=Vulgatibacter sp. TaxID=1971226 RepID=UPI00356AC366